MEISRAEFDEYSGGISNLSSSAQDNLSSFIDSLDFGNTEASIKEARNSVIEHMQKMVPSYSDASATLAADFYSEIIEAEKGKLIDALLVDPAGDNSIASSVRYSAKHLFGETVDVEAFKEGCLRSMDTYISRAANDTMRLNCLRDGTKYGVRYARVPSGITCSFCVMLASRGFVYATKSTAGEIGQYHSRCDCRIIPGFSDTNVEGYDPDKYYDSYADAYNAVQDKNSRASSEAVLAEMAKRDRLWLNTGEKPKITRAPGAKPSPAELATANRLSAHGIAVEFQPESNEYLKRAADYIDRTTGALWEIKQSRGNGSNNINNQLNSNRRSSTGHVQPQSDKVVIDISWHETNPSGLSHEELYSQAQRALKHHSEVSELVLVGEPDYRNYFVRLMNEK